VATVLQNVSSMNNKLLTAALSLTLFACGNPIVPPGEDLSASSQAELRLQSPVAIAPKTLDAEKFKLVDQKTKRIVWAAQVSDTATNPEFKTNFTIAETYDLFIAFEIPVALAGQHIAAFEVVSPNGAVYQRTEVPFSSAASTHYRVWSSMPVAGTWIQQFAMAGSWSVNVYLDGEQSSRASRTFILE
jgi:hypothetical protein